MKLLLTGDWHLRFKRPRNRLDESYLKAQTDKVEQILKIAKEYKASILQPGDFFDSADTPHFIVQHFISLLRKYNHTIYCVRGQHDLRYHSSNTENTPLAVMEAAGVVEVVRGPVATTDALFYGKSWQEKEAPKVLDGDYVNILLTHEMVIGDDKIYEKQKDFTRAVHMFRKYPDYDLIVAGDNHHTVFNKGTFGDKVRYVVNCGSLMRSAVDQVKHKPLVFIYDTVTRDIERVYLKVPPAKRVLNVVSAEVKKERDEKMEAFVDGLDEVETIGFDYLNDLFDYTKENKKTINKGTSDILGEASGDERFLDI